MPHFKMVFRYENPSAEETVVFAAPDRRSAEEACGSAMAEREALYARMESRNVYCSRRLVSCSLAKRGWREELLCVASSEDHV